MEKQSKRNLSESLASIALDALKNAVFSACSVGIMRADNEAIYRETHHYGCTDRDKSGAPVTDTTVYDLASLTKPMVTALVAMALVERGTVSLDDEIGLFMTGMRDDMARIRLEMLLSHSSGLAAHRPYYKILSGYPPSERKEAIIRLISKEKLVFGPGCGTLYSDLGFILLGYLIEKLSGRSLVELWKEEIAQPMGLQSELFFPGPEGLEADICAVTGVCGWSKKRLCGVVHDDNCRILGGVAGHAGLFGTVSGVLSLVEHLYQQYSGKTKHSAYSGSTLRKFLTKKHGSTWTYGFDTPSPGISSSGNLFSPTTVGHLGFTGTSFWLDLDRGIAIVLLTNRVLMGEDPTAIRKFRPLLHDCIMECLLEK